MKSHITSLTIFNIPFVNCSFEEIYNRLKNGGLMVVPAAPALANIFNDAQYYNALKNCTFAIPDSGFMVLILKYLKKININKLSGIEFIRRFVAEEELKVDPSIFLVDPSTKEKNINNSFLNKMGIKINLDNHFVAPMYNNHFEDYELLSILNQKKPKYILINLGGGVQEPLGLFLKNNLNYKPGIICTGAAISIVTKEQGYIPRFIDKIYLAWLARCLQKPKVFVPRYLNGFKLLPMLIKENITYKEKGMES